MTSGSGPWDEWIPGVLSETQIKTLWQEGFISVPNMDDDPDPSAMDLHLDNEGYKMVNGSVKPFGGLYLHSISKRAKDKLAEQMVPDTDGTYLLEPKMTYVFKLKERLLKLADSNIHGQATAKSSVGRLDVLVRLIVDGMNCYEAFGPEAFKNGGMGDLFLEITPMSFPVKVKEGISLTQLRLFYGEPSEIKGVELYRTLLRRDDRIEVKEGFLSVDVTDTTIWGGQFSAFCTKEDPAQKPINLWKPQDDREDLKPDPKIYWEPKKNTKYGTLNRFKIEKERFYILRSKEIISLPPGVAVYCRANDETIGEMRIHYAGFVHPYFGYKRDDEKRGTPLIFEVRGHDVNVSLGDDEKLYRLLFYRMSMDCLPPKKKPQYGSQVLNLSTFFRKV